MSCMYLLCYYQFANGLNITHGLWHMMYSYHVPKCMSYHGAMELLAGGPLDCSSDHVMYLFECKQGQYRFPYVGSTKTKFRYRINNYKSTHRTFRKKYVEKDLAIAIKKSELKQKLFREHYCSEGHQGIENWSVTLIDQDDDLDSLRKKELDKQVKQLGPKWP